MDRCSEYRRFSQEVSPTDPRAIREKSLEGLFEDFYTDRSGGDQPEDADRELLHMAGELLRNSPSESGQRSAVDADLTEKLFDALLRQEGVEI